MKGKKGKKSPTPSPQKSDEQYENEKQPNVGLDSQMLTKSDSTILNPNQLLGTLEATDSLFIPDDASSIPEEETDNLCKKGILTKEVLFVALSNIGYCATGTHQVYLNLSLPGYGLHDISVLLTYKHVQKLDLSFNDLTDLSALSNLKYLVTLNASHNQLQNLLDFTPPFGLKEADFSYNYINVIPNLSAYGHLVRLHMDYNNITQIDGLSQCYALHVLTLSHNKIEKIQRLDDLQVRELSLSHNLLSQIENLENVTQLQALSLSGNSISSLTGLAGCPVLYSLNVADNQIQELSEIHNVENIKSLRIINFTNNPISHTADYRKSVIFAMQHLTMLDEQNITVEEKVAAVNLFDPPPEMQTAVNHVTHTVFHFLQPSKIYESTLPSIMMPYPILVLTGPQASGKRALAHRLVQEFPDYFKLGVSHTTRSPRQGEGNGRDYHFVTPGQFRTLIRQGCFIQTCECDGYLYGLTLDAVERVAEEGLACVVHMEINGVRSLRNTYFEPRIVLIIPTYAAAHKEKMIERGVYSEAQISHIIKYQTKVYTTVNQQYPGFFDAVIESNKLVEAYDKLHQLVLDYLGISEFDSHEAEQDLLRPSTTDEDRGIAHPLTSSAIMKHSWSRASQHGDQLTPTKPIPVSNYMKMDSRRAPIEEASFQRRQTAAKEAIEGVMPSVCDELVRTPRVSQTVPAILESISMTQDTSTFDDISVAPSIHPKVTGEKVDERFSQHVKRPPNEKKTCASSSRCSNTSKGQVSRVSALSAARDLSDNQSNNVHSQKIISNNIVNIHDQPLDLFALSSALESLKGPLRGSSRESTPVVQKLRQDVDNWHGRDAVKPDYFSANAKPVLPPIPLGGH